MPKIKLVYLCHFSNETVRAKLNLYKGGVRELVLKLLNKNTQYSDFGSWNPLFLSGFENNTEFECHVVSPHYGMRDKVHHFELNGIHYHFFRCATTSLTRFIKYLNPRFRENPYKYNYKVINRLVDLLKPNIICMCGAENLDYSPSVLDIQGIPVVTILQTLLNSPKRVEMKVGSNLQREYEKDVLRHSSMIVGGTSNVNIIRKYNTQSPIVPISFPVEIPSIPTCQISKGSYCFYSVRLTPNKGIEDVIRAFARVYRKHSTVRLDIIGGYDTIYKQKLDSIITVEKLQEVVYFHGFQRTREDLFNIVSRAEFLVLPGLTAFNSTIREGMLLKKPVITYYLPNMSILEKNLEYLLVADYANILSLAERMQYAFEHSDRLSEMLDRSYKYAHEKYSSKSQSHVIIGYLKSAIK